MPGPLKNFLFLILLWSGFGFALNQYLEQKPVVTKNDLNAEESEAMNQGLFTAERDSVLVSIQREDNNLAALDNQTSADPVLETSPVVHRVDPVVLGPNALDIVRNTPEIIWQKNWKDLSELLLYNMEKNSDFALEIIGHYDPSEPIAEPNLGVQRSVRVKNELVALGFNPDRIKCRGDLQRLFEENSSVPSIFIKPSIPLTDPTEEELVVSEAVINSAPVRKNPNLPKYNSIVYHPSFSDQGVVLKSDLMELTPGVRQWLELDVQNYIELWGHTDHVGHDQDNYRLALKWARQMRQFFISQGIDSDRLKAFSAGEQQPLYTNSNTRGRLKNRRVELIFKY